MQPRGTIEQEAFRSHVRAFTANINSEASYSSLEEHFKFLVDFEHRLDEAGLAAVAWPKEYGGRGLGFMEYAIVCDELGRARAPEVINFVGIDVIAPALLAYAEEHRLSAWLPAMASADEIWCQLFSEPDAGSDLSSLRTSAERNRTGWTIKGQKVWSTWAQFATWGLLLARTGTSDSRHRGITSFVLNMKTPGIVVQPLKTMTGSSEFAEVFFDDIRLPHDAVIGEVDSGWEVAQVMLTAERGPYAIRRSAVLRGALVGLHELASQSTDRVARQRVADATILMELLDIRILDLVIALDQGKQVGYESALTKLLLGKVEQSIFTAAMGELGLAGLGRVGDNHTLEAWTEAYLYSRASTIYGGTQQIQKNIIGERLMGLPR
jgi:alkylation response protein AidB-like acyl-CoA dehydrogenase